MGAADIFSLTIYAQGKWIPSVREEPAGRAFNGTDSMQPPVLVVASSY